MNKKWLVGLVVCLMGISPVWADQTLSAKKVDQLPVLDGKAADAAWSVAPAIKTKDLMTGEEVTLKAVYNQDSLAILVQFADKVENRAHKLQFWDETTKQYLTGPQREDSFVLKWSMEGDPVDLSLSSDTPCKADVWFWKAHRTDHAGYADDKMDIYSVSSLPQSKKRLSKKGNLFYLVRLGDVGEPAYEGAVFDEFVKPEMPGFIFRQPSGSRADIRAKGVWQQGMWTIELGRKLQTGHMDDVQFTTQRRYQFGLSINEIAGREPDPTAENPLFGTGEVGENLTLVFE
ncbi:MAG: hypothetical protein HQL58_02030 [Magnetococcales bacterium]|nr:hypothetical protein [Magnetococcales bacterium]